jgi:hypothetical protein
LELAFIQAQSEVNPDPAYNDLEERFGGDTAMPTAAEDGNLADGSAEENS